MTHCTDGKNFPQEAGYNEYTICSTNSDVSNFFQVACDLINPTIF